MPDTIDVTKMKVADLKRELKVRGLAITGNKTELVDRLQAALIDGELLDDTAISGEELLEDEDAVLTDEDEEKIIDENELLKSPCDNKSSAVDLSVDLAALSSGYTAGNVPATTKKVVLKRRTSLTPSTTAELTTTTTAQPSKENTAPTPPKLVKLVRVNSVSDKVEDAATVSERSENNANSALATAVKKVTQLTLQERMELRAKKFGLNVDTNVSVGEAGSSVSSASDTNPDKEAEILKKRAERFGCVVSSKMVQLDAAERLQKRKERFGGANNSAKVDKEATAGTNPSSDVWAEKARQRLERFKSNASDNSPTAVATTASTSD